MKARPFKAGEIFWNWTLLEEVQSEKQHRKALARCSCGTVKVINLASVRSGQSRSCKRCSSAMRSRRHGGWKTSEYHIWQHMRQRCENTSNPRYGDYGGRGIFVCESWRKSFGAFLSDMGKRPSTDHSLDRIDNDGPYSSNNCRWATRKEQRANQRPNRWERIALLVAGDKSDEVRKMVAAGVCDEEIASYISG